MRATSRFMLRCVVGGTSLLAAVATFSLVLLEPVRVRGESMSPCLSDGDLLAVTKAVRVPQREMIVVVERPDRPGVELVKRIVALPGDRSSLAGDRSPLPEVPALLAAGEYWVLGDNSRASTDSRDFGPVGVGQLRGRALCIYWPPAHWAWLGGRPRSVLFSE